MVYIMYLSSFIDICQAERTLYRSKQCNFNYKHPAFQLIKLYSIDKTKTTIDLTRLNKIYSNAYKLKTPKLFITSIVFSCVMFETNKY